MKKEFIFLKAALTWVFVFGLIYFPAVSSMAQSKEPVVLRNWLQNHPQIIEEWRMLSEDLEKLGIQVKLEPGTIEQWVGEIVGGDKNPYHTVAMSWGGGPDRLDPSFFLTEFFHSSRAVKGGRNYGHYVNKEYDAIIDAQEREMDTGKRQKLVRKAQEIIHKDNPFFPIFHTDIIQAYNKERIEGVIPVMGTCIGFPHIPWTFFKAKPKTNIREPRVVNIHDMQTKNPFLTPDVENENWLRLIYDTFAKRDADTNIIPWAAESWKVVDNTTVDIVLRDGMKFHDGKPVTVDDVKFTFDYINKWKFPPLGRAWRNVESVQLLGGRNVRIKLFHPYAPFAENILLHVFIAPKHIWEKIPESVGVKNPTDWANPDAIGSGPYQLVEWKRGEYFHLKANKNHWVAPNFDGLYYIVNPTIDGIMAMLEKGQAEIVGWYLDSKQGKQLDAFPHLKMVKAPSHGLHEIRPNCNMKPTSDPKFREAFQHVINRRAMLNVILEGYGSVCHNTPINPLIKLWNNPDIPVMEFSLDKARSILKAAGYTWDAKGHLCYP